MPNNPQNPNTRPQNEGQKSQEQRNNPRKDDKTSQKQPGGMENEPNEGNR